MEKGSAGKTVEKGTAGGAEGKYEGLPVESSPYTQYKDVEDYKRQGYGTEGHVQPEPGRGAAASTDAPTVAGGAVSSQSQLSSGNTK